MAANGTGSVVLIDDLSADRSREVDSVMYRAILSAHIHPNAIKLVGCIQFN